MRKNRRIEEVEQMDAIRMMAEMALLVIIVISGMMAWVYLYVIPQDKMRDEIDACIRDNGLAFTKRNWEFCESEVRAKRE